MKRYEIHTVETAEEILRAPVARIDSFRWMANGYEPRTEASMVCVRGQGFLARLTSFERDLRCECHEQDGAVCRDSCLEFFINFAPEKGGNYLNLEVNPIGTLHCKIGPGRAGRSLVPQEIERPHVNCTIQPDRWSADIFIPIASVEALFGKNTFPAGDLLRGNFYKCGDDTAFPHYGMWNPVQTERPDFHRPEYFGVFVIV